MKSKSKNPLFGSLLIALLLLVYSAVAQMTVAEVQLVLAQAATRARQISPNSIIAVVDREGFVLGALSVSTNRDQTTLAGTMS